MTQDGTLTYGYDKNGNRTSVGYPGGVAAAYARDFADRESTLAVTSAAGTQPVVTASSYLPSGPLASLALGNGTAETRSFTTRYFPETIALDAARDRSYTFMTDAVGNVESIDEAVECLSDVALENRTITGAEVHQSCGKITAGPAVDVAAGGSLTLRAATSVVLQSGFSVSSEATFSAGTDPNLDGSTWSFDYQDVEYFLTSAIGPWGDLAWSYDKIGNRLSETRDSWTDVYAYAPNGTGGRTPLLSEIQLAIGGTRTFTHGPAGHLTQVSSSGNVVDFSYDAAGRLEQADRLGAVTHFAYDGRSYLTAAGSEAAATGASHPVYSSGGLLHTLTQRITASDPGEAHQVFHFAGRPVAQLSVDGATETWRYLTTDHLGTPLIATDAAGAELWHGPFEPFGRDRWAGTNLAASDEDIFLRPPGQWDDEVWLEATRGAEVYYNLHRWYAPATGRYTKPDPLLRPFSIAEGNFQYALGNPNRFIDPGGLFEIDPSCSNCRHPFLARDPTPLSLPVLKETGAFCQSQLDAIIDVNLRRCINESCHIGKIICVEGDEDLCAESDVLGFTRRAGGAFAHFLRRSGVLPAIREAYLCANKAANFSGYAGSTIIHEWAHGCGYNPHGSRIPGIPHVD